MLGMARRPFDPRAEGWEKVSYRQGDILDRDRVDAAARRRRRRRPSRLRHLRQPRGDPQGQPRGQPQRLRGDARRRTPRLVYTSSVAAYGFHGDNPQPLTEDVPPRGSEGFYYSAQKAELEALLESELLGSATEAYVFRPSIVAGRRATMLVEQALKQVSIGGRLPRRREGDGDAAVAAVPAARASGHRGPVSALSITTTSLRRSRRQSRTGTPGVYNLAGEGEITLADMARALGWYSVPVPAPAVGVAGGLAGRLSFLSAELEWVNALRVPVVMDTSKARRELGWEPLSDAGQTLLETVEGAQAAGILG